MAICSKSQIYMNSILIDLNYFFLFPSHSPKIRTCTDSKEMITNSIHNQLIWIKEKKRNTQSQVSKAESYLDHQISMLSYPLVVHEEYITDNYGYWYRMVENRCFSKILYLVWPWKISLLQGRYSSLKMRVDWPARKENISDGNFKNILWTSSLIKFLNFGGNLVISLFLTGAVLQNEKSYLLNRNLL